MANKQFNKLVKAYEKACNDIVALFCKTYEVSASEQDWVANEVGGTICFDEEFFLNMDDIILMLKKEASWTDFLKWWDYNLDVGSLNLNPINLRSWLRGAPKYNPESLDRIKKLHEEIDELTKNALDELESY